MRLTMSSMASISCWFQEEPAVSMAIGMKMCVAVRFAYYYYYYYHYYYYWTRKARPKKLLWLLLLLLSVL